MVKNLANEGDTRDTDSIPRSGRSPGVGNGNPLQYSCLGTPQDRGAGQATVCACMLSHFSCVRLFATFWTVALKAPLSMGFSRQEYWSGWPFSSPGDLPDLEIEAVSLTSPALAGRYFSSSTTWEAPWATTPWCHIQTGLSN